MYDQIRRLNPVEHKYRHYLFSFEAYIYYIDVCKFIKQKRKCSKDPDISLVCHFSFYFIQQKTFSNTFLVKSFDKIHLVNRFSLY